MKSQIPHPPAAPSRASRAATSSSRDRRSHRVLASVVAVGAMTVSGCGFATDTPLHVSDVARAVAPGQDVVGKVGYPDGKITVTLVPEASPREDGHRTVGETPCEYQRSSHAFTCSTGDLDQGLYLVQVTDARQPGEGTAQAQVAITDIAGYDPHLVVGDGTERAKAGPVPLKLTGWRTGGTVRITFLDGNNKPAFTRSVVPDAKGAATLVTTPLRAGYYNIVATDGLWKINGNDGSYNDAYSALEVS